MLAKIHDVSLSVQQQRELLQKFILSADFKLRHADFGVVTKVHVGVSEAAQEFSDNLSRAKKLNKLGYNVYLLPTLKSHTSADYILEKEGKIWLCELKTIYGKNSISHRFKKAKRQADRVVVNIVGHISSRKVACEIKTFFEEYDKLKEILVLKSGKLICVRRGRVAEKKFIELFMKDWNK